MKLINPPSRQSVTPDALNRLVASAADDSSIIGICGETKLDNEEGSWWTMIQVYEYYISHHLAKAFESLFGSVTCLPGCFSLYRIRTADKGRPIIISNRIIDDYAEGNVDTLHKKNLFSLGEDRYLTTLLTKHFPTYKLKFTPDAIAHTIAPESWSVLLSQRRRWINSTVHNLCELVTLPDLCGICCFSMRFIVFIDLIGTIVSLRTSMTNPLLTQLADSACHCRLRKFMSMRCISTFDINMAHLACILNHRRCNWVGSYPHRLNHHDCSRLWFAGAHLHHQARVYARRLDGRVYPFVPCLQFLPPNLLLLVHG